MTSNAADRPPAPGLSGPVLVAAACFTLGAGSAVSLLGPGQDAAGCVLPLGWAGFGIAGAVLLDRAVAPRPARVLTGLALVPLAVLALGLVRHATDGAPGAARRTVPAAILDAFAATAALQAVAVLVGVTVAACPSAARPVRSGAAVLAVAGAVATVAAPTRVIGWAATVLGCAVVLVDALVGARGGARAVRRRTVWLVGGLATSAVLVAVACWTLSPLTAGMVVGAVLALLAGWVARLFLAERFRPLDEHLLDVVLVVAAVAAAVGIGGLVRLGAVLTRVPSPDTSATIAAVLTTAAAAPAALWARRSLLARRYGPGVIAPSDVAVITADLRARADPRDLLDKAARMVATASGCRDARLVLGDEPPEVPPTWVIHPLDIGGERVGTLAVEASGPEGLEARQADDVARLVPTVALVAHAVTLAVEAELARRDVARERDAERRRILADLHDGLGPVLAGMSMRVRAALRANGSAAPEQQQRLLADLADGLAASRTDLRRIVSGITPSALDDGDLTAALERLVDSFRGQDGPTVVLSVDPGLDPGEAVGVTVYRCVAEGVTNALRHANATRIEVHVASSPGRIDVRITDDGAGGAIVPGVGLSSLRARAESLGGRLTVSGGPAQGTTLCLTMPFATDGEAMIAG